MPLIAKILSNQIFHELMGCLRDKALKPKLTF